jgi:hypothetical protein
MFDTGTLVRSAYRHLDFASLLRQPVDALMGVSPAAKEELRQQHIVTVLDLAASALFREAAMLVAAADDPNSEWALAGRAPRTAVDAAIAELPIEIIADRQIEDLRPFSETVAGRVSEALTVSTIRELAGWPPYLAARQIFQQVVGLTDPGAVWDPGTPPELVPTMGRHPTERVYYQNVILDRFLDPPSIPVKGTHVTGLPAAIRHAMAQPLESAGQVDLASSLLRSPGFERVAVGAIVQFSQSWYTSGLSLGQLLHSLALAPGESTRIAMIDWRRRERGNRAEGTQESDRLVSDLSRNRALNEVVTAVAREVQSGSSAAQVSGESFGFGKSGGGGGTYGGEGQSYGFGGGYSLGYGTGKGQSSSWGVSTGDRNLRSELTQNIQDLTHQASTMTRNRWATVVQEVSQEEHEQLSTRAVTNYNHMHALTVEYYEVIQIYRVAIDIDRITRCLFVPMKVLDFRRFEVITRFRGILADGALNAQTRATLLSAPNSVVLIPARRSQPWNQGSLDRLNAMFGRAVGFPDSAEISFPRNIQPWGLMVGVTGDNTNTQEFPFDSALIEFDGAPALTLPITELGPTEASDLGRKFVDFRPVFGTSENAKDFWNIRGIAFKRKAGKEAFTGEIFVTTAIDTFGTARITNTSGMLALFLQVQADELITPVYSLMRTTTDAALAQHMEENALYYSQLIWRNLDPAELSLALAGYTIGGQPLMQVIDPTPVMIAGNYMVFRSHIADESWQKFLESKQLSVGPVSSTIVPLPSGGVFAEAVLGRANSAEKLDMTRFWNWQDSPIPITAPDIATLQAGSRNQGMNLDTGKLSPSVLNIMNPPALPDPTGMTAALGALAQGAMFRDMSGLAATIGLAGTGLQEAFKGSSDAQKYAMENFKTAASLFSKSGGGKSSTVTEDGAKAVQGQNMDAREKNDPGSVGPAEKAAFQSSLSAPPLVQAEPEGSSPDEWVQWPDQQETSPPGGKGVKTSPKGGKATGLPPKSIFEIVFRAFIPSPAVPAVSPTAVLSSLVPLLPAGSWSIGFSGDNRTASYAASSYRAEIVARVTTDGARGPFLEEPITHFGETAQWDGDQIEHKSGFPWWWFDVLPNETTTKRHRLTRTPENLNVEVARDAVDPDLIHVRLLIEARIAADDPIIAATAPTISADLKLSIWEKAGYTPQFSLQGTHDGFPAFELYINGKTFHSYDPRNVAGIGPLALSGQADRQFVGKKNEVIPGVIPGR